MPKTLAEQTRMFFEVETRVLRQGKHSFFYSKLKRKDQRIKHEVRR